MSLVTALMTLEIGLRLAGLNFASPYVHDPQAGARLKPNHTFWHRSEGVARITTNREGLRDRDHTFEKPIDVYRIAVLGDSFAEALQVEQPQTFWAILEGELNRQPPIPGKCFEVLNFGISGYGTTQSLQMLRHTAWNYDPDLVLLVFLPGNDLRNNSKDLEPHHGRPFYVEQQGTLVLDESFRDDPVVQRLRQSSWLKFKDWLINRSRTLSLVYHLRHLPTRQAAAPLNAEQLIEEGIDTEALVPPMEPAWQRAWDLTGKIMGLMAEEATSHQARLVVVEANNSIQVDPDPQRIADYARKLGSSDLDEPTRQLQEFATQYQFTFVSLTPLMRAEAQQSGVYFHGFSNTKLGTGHWNEAGHQFAGKSLARTLSELFTAANP